MSRTHRRPYSGAKSFDSSCRCHGGCPYCEEGRMYRTWKRIPGDEIEQRELDIDYRESTELSEEFSFCRKRKS